MKRGEKEGEKGREAGGREGEERESSYIFHETIDAYNNSKNNMITSCFNKCDAIGPRFRPRILIDHSQNTKIKTIATIELYKIDAKMQIQIVCNYKIERTLFEICSMKNYY